jgi:hypothetical protein
MGWGLLGHRLLMLLTYDKDLSDFHEYGICVGVSAILVDSYIETYRVQCIKSVPTPPTPAPSVSPRPHMFSVPYGVGLSSLVHTLMGFSKYAREERLESRL